MADALLPPATEGVAPLAAPATPRREEAAPLQRQLPGANGAQGGLLYSTAAQALGFNLGLHEAFVQALDGAWDTTSLTEVFQVSEEDLMQAMADITNDDIPLGPLPRGKLRSDLRKLAELAGFEPPVLGGLHPKVTQEAVREPVRPAESVPAPTLHSFSEFLMQGDKGNFQELPAPKLRLMRDRFEEVHGGPRDYEDPTSLQLSALAAKLASDKAPVVDMAVFGPFGRRLQKLLFFNAEVMIAGAWARRKMLGPSDFETWRKGWRVYRTAALILGFSKPGPVDDFEEGVRQLAVTFPNHWGLIYITVGHMIEER